MERTIDRTSYRRSARVININERIEEPKIKNRKFCFTNMILNQIIVSLLIIIGILTANYFDQTKVINWISNNLSSGYSAIELASKVKNKLFPKSNNSFYLLTSGDLSGDFSGENMLDFSGEKLLGMEKIYSGELITAVEGVNQIADDSKIIKEKYDFYMPVEGTITSHFGSRVSDNPIVSNYHTGLDIGAETGTDICSAHNGKVIMAQNYSSYGNCVMVEDEDLITVYAHCSSLLVKEGQIVKKGDVIAKVGMTGNATGPHLHFEIRYQERFVDPEKVLY